jgi:hypothetical protein
MRSAIATAALAVAATVLIAVPPRIGAEVVGGGNVKVSFRGSLLPKKLPRLRPAPVSLHVAGSVTPVPGTRPAGLREVLISVNRHGVISTAGLPVCPRRKLLSTTTRQALAACPGAVVGVGHFSAHVDIPEQAPFPSDGELVAFNSRVHGHMALVAHVFGSSPVPTSQALPMTLRRKVDGEFGATLKIEMPNVGDEWGYVTGFELTLSRRYSFHGRRRSVLSASCPAPRGFPSASFRAARAVFELDDGRQLTRVVSARCRVAG